MVFGDLGFLSRTLAVFHAQKYGNIIYRHPFFQAQRVYKSYDDFVFCLKKLI